jgi:DNA topoisomerase-1
MKLFIVESPTKAKTIQRFLGKDFVVRATFGHVMDLPQREIGVDEESLRARYVFLRGKKKVMEGLKKLALKSDEVYIGTDPDREGEAIAFFVAQFLKETGKPLKRAVFYEITPSSIRESIRTAGEINMNLVYAQFARRILDRLIGYRVSPYLWKGLGRRGLSAGRVQSPALRLTVEREREIESFRPRTYYYVGAILEKEGESFRAYYPVRYENPSDAKIIQEKLEKSLFGVKEISRRLERVAPPRPFITSSLQSSANSLLGMPAEKAQGIAQKLYEAGYITYPRTDSHRMNPRKAEEFMEYIAEKFGRNYVGRLRKFRESPSSQGAHECIRPVSLTKRSPGGESGGLYRLILNRTLASLMAEMEVERTKITIEAFTGEGRNPLFLEARGVRIVFEGWSRVYPTDVEEELLPHLSEGEVLKLKKTFIEEKKTKPPPRYTEGSLVKTLERLGIGRPSTYATILKTLKKRRYVVLNKRSLVPTDIAFAVVDFLMENFPLMMSYEFTAKMEEELDRVERGEILWKEVVRRFLEEVFSQVV